MKRFIGKILLFGAIIASLIVAFNIIVDPYGVIRGDLTYVREEPNQHYIKLKYVINNPNKYDSYLFGSSRVGKIDPRNIHDGDAWYNMSYSLGLPKDFYEDIKLMIENNVNIKNVAIGLEEISYLENPNNTRKHTLRKPYKNCVDPLYEYIFLKPSLFSLQLSKPKDTANGEAYILYDLYNSGLPIAHRKDEYINENPEEHNNDTKFTIPNWPGHYINRTDKAIATIKKTHALCEANNINCTFFINPMHIVTYSMQDMKAYECFLKKVIEFSDVYDFSGVNEVTTNNFYYYETSHFRPIVGDKMIDILFHQKQSDIKNFGTLLTKQNIDSVLNIKQSIYTEYTNNKKTK